MLCTHTISHFYRRCRSTWPTNIHRTSVTVSLPLGRQQAISSHILIPKIGPAPSLMRQSKQTRVVLVSSIYAEPTLSLASLPSNDSNSWYYPAAGHVSDENDMPIFTSSGNWGRKTTRGARWVRKGKLAAWGPGIEDWEVCLQHSD